MTPKYLAVQLLDIYTTAENAADDPSVETCKVATEILYRNPPTSKRNRCVQFMGRWHQSTPISQRLGTSWRRGTTGHQSHLPGGPCKENPRAPLGVGSSPLGVFLSPSGIRRSVEFLVAALRLGGREAPRYPPHLVAIRSRAMTFLSPCCGRSYIW